MRGTTVKRINKFVRALIKETPKDQIDKSPEQLTKEVKVMWRTGKKAQTFIRKVANGEFNG